MFQRKAVTAIATVTLKQLRTTAQALSAVLRNDWPGEAQGMRQREHAAHTANLACAEGNLPAAHRRLRRAAARQAY